MWNLGRIRQKSGIFDEALYAYSGDFNIATRFGQHLSSLSVTGSEKVLYPNFKGLYGVTVRRDGDDVVIEASGISGNNFGVPLSVNGFGPIPSGNLKNSSSIWVNYNGDGNHGITFDQVSQVVPVIGANGGGGQIYGNLVGRSGVSVTQSGTTFFIESNGGGANPVNSGDGVGIYSHKTDSAQYYKTVRGVSGIQIIDSGNGLIITQTDATVLTASGTILSVNGSGPLLGLYNAVGIGGLVISLSGSNVLFSGGAGGGGGGSTVDASGNKNYGWYIDEYNVNGNSLGPVYEFRDYTKFLRFDINSKAPAFADSVYNVEYSNNYSSWTSIFDIKPTIYAGGNFNHPTGYKFASGFESGLQSGWLRFGSTGNYGSGVTSQLKVYESGAAIVNTFTKPTYDISDKSQIYFWFDAQDNNCLITGNGVATGISSQDGNYIIQGIRDKINGYPLNAYSGSGFSRFNDGKDFYIRSSAANGLSGSFADNFWNSPFSMYIVGKNSNNNPEYNNWFTLDSTRYNNVYGFDFRDNNKLSLDRLQVGASDFSNYGVFNEKYLLEYHSNGINGGDTYAIINLLASTVNNYAGGSYGAGFNMELGIYNQNYEVIICTGQNHYKTNTVKRLDVVDYLQNKYFKRDVDVAVLAGGGGGVSVYGNPADVPPISPNAQDDEFNSEQFDYSKWGGIRTGDFNFLKNKNGKAYMDVSSQGGKRLFGIYQNIDSSVDWEYQAKFSIQNPLGNYPGPFMFCGNSGNNKWTSNFIVQHNSYAFRPNLICEFQGLDAEYSYSEAGYGNFYSNEGYFKIGCQSGNLYFGMSNNGDYFKNVTTRTTGWMGAPDVIGIGVHPYNADVLVGWDWFRKTI